MRKNYIVMIFLSLIVSCTVIYGFIDGGSPRAARNKRYDDTRIQNIQSISNSVNRYYQRKMVLPYTILEASTDSGQGGYLPEQQDPETNIAYGYQIVSDKEYKVCATFATDTINNTPQYLAEFAHPSGLYCLTLKVDKN